MRRLANPAPSTHCTGDPDGRMDGRKKRKTDDPLSPRLPARWPSRQGPARRRHPLRSPRGGLCGFCGPRTRGGLGSGILRSRRRRARGPRPRGRRRPVLPAPRVPREAPFPPPRLLLDSRERLRVSAGDAGRGRGPLVPSLLTRCLRDLRTGRGRPRAPCVLIGCPSELGPPHGRSSPTVPLVRPAGRVAGPAPGTCIAAAADDSGARGDV